MYSVKTLLSILILIAALTASSNEDKKSQSAAESFSGKQDQSWELVQNELAALKTKVDAQSALVNSLIEQKSSLRGEQLSAHLADIKKQHQKYEQLVLEYNKKNEEFLTRYPERGLREKRTYKRVKIKTLESFEDDQTFRGRMNKLHKKVLSQYPKAAGSDQNNNKSNTAAEEAGESQKSVTDPIQFKK